MNNTGHSVFTLIRTTRNAAAVTIDEAGYILDANEEFLRLCVDFSEQSELKGVEPGELVGTDIFDFIPEGDRDLWRQTITHGATGAIQSAELLWRGSFGERYLEIVITPLTIDSDGNEKIVRLTLRDATDAHETEQRVLKIAGRFQAVLESSVDLNTSIQEPQEVYRAAMEKLSTAIEFDTGTIQLLEEDAYLRVVAHSGFMKEGPVNTLRFPLDERFPNVRVVRSKRALALADIRNDFPHFLTEEGQYESGHIRSWLGVPIIDRGDVWGMITLDRNRVAPFDSDDIELATAIANHAGVAIANSRLYTGLQRAHTVQKTLMQELHHRVKNNMQLISSLLTIRGGHVDEETGNVLAEVRTRILSLAAVHESLYESPDLDMIKLNDYVDRVVSEIDRAYSPGSQGITIDAHVPDEIRIHIDIAIPFGMILSELLLNAVKHAFPNPERSGIVAGAEIKIDVALIGDEAHQLEVIVADNGRGIEPALVDSDSFGMILIRTLVEQLGAETECSPGMGSSLFGQGTTWTLTIPLKTSVVRE